jgi:hypothetical protein
MFVLKLFFILVLIILIPVYPIFIHFIIRILYYRIFKKYQFPVMPSTTKQSIFNRLYIQFPKRLVNDMLLKVPDDFQEYGIRMVCGEQGSGKTITVVYLLMQWAKRYENMKVITNMNYAHEHAKLSHWKDIMNLNNGTKGVAVVIDEIQTWFSSLQSKDFPIEMLTELSQQRKQRKVILGTAQVFSRIGKPIREQTHIVYVPQTYFGCLTIVRVTKSQYWDDNEQRFKKYDSAFFFVHSDEIRNAFDTFLKIQKYKDTGFKPESERMIKDHVNPIYLKK